MAGTPIEQARTLYRNSYNSIGGVDIKCVVAGFTFGNLQAISYSITREKAPVYTMGSPECRAYARGKRSIAGNLVMVMFDDHALLQAMERATSADEQSPYRFVTDYGEIRPTSDDHYGTIQSGSNQVNSLSSFGLSEYVTSFAQSNGLPSSVANGSLANGLSGLNMSNAETAIGDHLEENWARFTPWYSDQIPAFNIVLTGVNEDGAAATMSILGVEILNEGYGISIDDLISEQQMTYVARAIARWRPLYSAKLTAQDKGLGPTRLTTIRQELG